MDTLKILEVIGQSPKLKNMPSDQSRELLRSMLIPELLITPLLTNDRQSLEEIAGFKQDIICFVLSPAREREVPKDDNKPPEEDEDREPYENSSLLKFG